MSGCEGMSLIRLSTDLTGELHKQRLSVHHGCNISGMWYHPARASSGPQMVSYDL